MCVSITSVSSLYDKISGADMCVRLFEEVTEREREREVFLICRYMEGDALLLPPINLQRIATDRWGHSSIVYSMNEYLNNKT
jgi:hypothetical protein